MDPDVFVTPGLGDNSYLLTSRGQAAVIDPQRDAWRMLSAAKEKGTAVRYALETHVHNDYVSGAAEVRAAAGAEVVGPAGSGFAFPFVPMEEGRELELGGLRLVAMATSGHTPEHVAYLLYEEGSDEPSGVFTGGSLIVGSAGRTDLLGAGFTDDLTRAQYRSLRRLAALPAGTRVLPTHGAGSFCVTAAPDEERTSTIERERSTNPALADLDEEAFVKQQLTGLLAYPAYYANMASINRAGPAVFRSVREPPALSVEAFERHADRGWVIDGREGSAFARAHLPGSINIGLDSSFASYVGWVVPLEDPLLLVLPAPERESLTEACTQLFRIGFDHVLGYLEGGFAAWRSAGRGVRSYPVSGVDDLLAALRGGSPTVLDVRQRNEWDAGHLPGTRHLFVGNLLGRLGGLPSDREVWTVCATGHRAGIAASVLDRAGLRTRLVAPEGVPKALRRLA